MGNKTLKVIVATTVLWFALKTGVPAVVKEFPDLKPQITRVIRNPLRIFEDRPKGPIIFELNEDGFRVRTNIKKFKEVKKLRSEAKVIKGDIMKAAKYLYGPAKSLVEKYKNKENEEAAEEAAEKAAMERLVEDTQKESPIINQKRKKRRKSIVTRSN